MDIVRVRQLQWSMEKWGWQPNVLDHILRITNWDQILSRRAIKQINLHCSFQVFLQLPHILGSMNLLLCLHPFYFVYFGANIPEHR